MSGDDHTGSTGTDSTSAVPAASIVVVVAAMAAAWIAAGSTGLLADPLRHALSWVAMAVALLAGRPQGDRRHTAWLALAVVLALAMTAVDLPAANVLAVALLTAALAWSQDTAGGRAILIAALAAGTLGIFRLAVDSIPALWLGADALGHLLGRVAGTISGRPLSVGITFGGVDFLVLMAALYAGWLVSTPPPRRRRAIYAAAAVLLGHLAYLVVLSFSNQILASLPAVVVPPPSDNSMMGVWAWGNAVRTLVPWNLPALAVLIHAAIAVAMFRWAPCLPAAESLPSRGTQPIKPAGQGRWSSPYLVYLPVVLAAVVPLVVVMAPSRSDLAGKTIVAARQGFLDWDRPEYDSQSAGMYGMLEPLVEGLGGRLVISADLSQEDLDQADVLLLLHPNQNWPHQPAASQRVWEFVRRGGALLVAAEPEIVEDDLKSTFNELLRPTAIRVRRDTAASETLDWEQACQIMAHPALTGIGDRRNRLGLTMGSSLDVRWPARPLLVGRWAFGEPGSDALATGAFQYDAGENLGDLVLAAEQSVGRGTVVVLGDISSLHNDVIANSYVFVGRLLGYLAGTTPRAFSPQAWWRQLLGLLLAGACVALLYRRASPLRTGLAAAVLGASAFACTACSHHVARVLPGGPADGPKLACIDASHLEAYSSDTWGDFGIAGLCRALARSGYLPLLLPDLTAERLEHAELLISIAPARRFSPGQRQVVEDFVRSGGTFICMAGAEHAAAGRELIEQFGLRVPPSPVPPTQRILEPEPLGRFRTFYLNTDQLQAAMQTYAGWEVTCDDSDYRPMAQWSDGAADRPVIISRSVGSGTVVLIGDTYLAVNQNLESAVNTLPENVVFWRWLISHVTDQDDWEPPPRRPAPRDLPSELLPEAPPGASAVDAEDTSPPAAAGLEAELPAELPAKLPAATLPTEDPAQDDPASDEVTP